MRISNYFNLLVLLLIALGIVLFFLLKGGNWIHLLLVEGGIVAILCFLSLFHQKIIKPLNSLDGGMDLLREQDFSSRLSRVGQYDADRIVTIFNRMMDQLRNERLRLREQHHFLDLLINASPQGVIIASLDYEVTQLNPMAMKLLGVANEEAVVGKRLEHVGIPLATELARIPRDQAAVVRLNDANVYKCTHYTFVDHGFNHPFYLIERMTDELMRAERRAYEKVIRMIAHEVNNTTAGITSALDSVEQALNDDPAMEDICAMMRVCTDRCYSMSSFITRFADVVKIPEPTLQRTSINTLTSSCKQFMEGVCAERGISLRLECDPGVGERSLDSALIQQVLVNIIKNAAESVESLPADERQRGEIVIRTVAPATVEVADNGAGIAPEAEAKLFTPFYSTKPNGQGIGLMFIREVLSRHRCNFSLHTDDDNWTRFTIRFE